MKTEIAKDIERAHARVQYDTQCKKVLSNKHILAWIMQAAIREYSHLSIDFIRRCIEGEPEISDQAVESGWNDTEKVQGLNTEDNDAEEGMITYDMRYAAYMPRDAKSIKILVNVEAQKDFYPGYPIESRGVYYGSRMVSSQNGVEFQIPKYEDIKKVFSIWLCMDAPQYVGDAISVYEMEKRDIVPGIPEHHEDYDKMSIILICLSGNPSGERSFFDLMNTLLSPTMDVERKKNILRNEYQIPMETGFVKELDLMCNLSEWVYETGIERGIESGMQQGIDKTRKEIISNLLKSQLLTDEQIMCAVSMTKEEFTKMKAVLHDGL